MFLYNFFVRAYHSLIYLFSFFNPKAKLFVEGRKNTFLDLAKKLEGNTAPLAWFHCASLGEFEQGRPVIEAFKKDFPHSKILLTFFSPSGYEVRKNYEFADVICYLPMDSAKNAAQFISIIKPKIAFFVKYEFWYHYVNELHKKNIPIISFSAIFRKEQVFFKPYGYLFRRLLQKFSHIFVQNEVSVDLLKSIGIAQVSLCGDTRFDRVWAIRESKKEISSVKLFKNNKTLMVVGSSWEQDIRVIAEALKDFSDPLRLIIAPHEISENNLQFVENQIVNKKIVRFSVFDKNPKTNNDFDILLIDNVGMLSSLYQYGEFAFVGGGFKQGLHNILEPAVFGMPIFFGNKAYKKYDEANSLISRQVAFPINDGAELHTLLLQHLFGTERYKLASTNCTDFVKKNLGASEKILAYCNFFSFSR
ncbi:MAG: 3-deoxy-D-manno-octulosonic acid transferase [Cytophagales bacterium]|nr:MAG: 3-deoxy-D-manno-octulosonic acid transferase [Cytophagales bacterium]